VPMWRMGTHLVAAVSQGGETMGYACSWVLLWHAPFKEGMCALSLQHLGSWRRW
jgi:hypothetical protein